MSYFGDVLIGGDMFISTLIPGGVPGETMSARAGSAWIQSHLRGKICCPCIDILMWLCRQYPTPRGHCVHAFELGDIQRARAILASRA